MPLTCLWIDRRLTLGSILLGLSAGLCGCSGSGAGLDSSGQPSSGATTVPIGPTFEAIQENVFTPICSVCHIGATAPEGLRLDAANSYNLLVNVPSTEVPGLNRIKPGDPDSSYLIQKIEGHAAVGGQMPLGEAPLPAATIADIVQWVTNGAQNDSASSAALNAVAADFRVAVVAPEQNDVVAGSPPQIMIGFTRALDATRVSATAVRLERIPVADEPSVSIAVSLSVPAANPRVLMLTPIAPLPVGQYRVVLRDASGAGISALSGEPLVRPPADTNGNRIVTRFAVTDVTDTDTP
jgi:hypothetical protein